MKASSLAGECIDTSSECEMPTKPMPIVGYPAAIPVTLASLYCRTSQSSGRPWCSLQVLGFFCVWCCAAAVQGVMRREQILFVTCTKDLSWVVELELLWQQQYSSLVRRRLV